MSKHEAIALAILDNVSGSTLNDIVCDLAARGKVEHLRAMHEIKGAVPFVKREGAPVGERYHDPFKAAAGRNQLEAVEVLLELGLLPEFKLQTGGKEYYCGALTDAVEKVMKSDDEQMREVGTDVAITLYRAVRTQMTPNFVLHFSDYNSSYSKVKTPASLLDSARANRDVHGREIVATKPLDTLLSHCLVNRIDRLASEIMDYVDSTKDGKFTDRDAQVMIVMRDMAGFARTMQYTGEVSLDLMRRILALPADLQPQALEIIGDKDVPEKISDELAKLTDTITPETLFAVLSATSKEIRGDALNTLLIKATQSDNLPLMRELIAMGEKEPGWNIDAMVTISSPGSSYTRREIPIHGCRSGDAVRLLLAHGADIECRDHDGRTPLQVAVGHGDGDNSIAVASALINAGADMGLRLGGRTLIQLAGPKAERMKGVIRSGRTADAVEAALDEAAQDSAGASRRGAPFSPL